MHVFSNVNVQLMLNNLAFTICIITNAVNITELLWVTFEVNQPLLDIK